LGDQQLLAKRRRKCILILEIFTVALALMSLEVYFNFLGTLVGVAHNLGRDRMAETLFGQGLFVQERARGPNSPAVSDTLDDIAYFYYDTDQSDKAIAAVERSLAICKAKFGTNGPSYAWTL